ncbi:MAG TPA: hypothetical protein VNQ32_07335 [Steroidobacteraceae bacterium]|nr:hypothetical protein [Steroidobacteraceae bacterium]
MMVGTAAVFVLLAGCGSNAPEEPAVPDLSGIWVLDANGRAGAALNGVGDFEKTAPFTPAARAKLAEYHALVDPTGDTPGAHCVPHGMPLTVFLGGGYPVEFIQRPEQLTLIYETHNEVRRIFLDGRKIDPADVLPSRDGMSWGHWEGDTLVVETSALTESIDQATAHSANARIIERYTPRLDNGVRRMRVEVTIDDPEFYTQPPVLEREYTGMREGRMLDYNCVEPLWEDYLEELRRKRG